VRVVIKTNDLATLACASALLEGEAIHPFVMDVHMSNLEGSIGVLPRRLLVADCDFEEACDILRDNGLDVLSDE